MAEVKMNIGAVSILNEQTAPHFTVSADGSKLGELRVSKGGVRWLARGLQEDAHFVSWAKFDAWMKSQPRR